jgi:uncharacterized protein (TIGR03435 family)
MRAITGATLIVFTSCGAFGQTEGKLPEFEVASVKPAPPPTGPGLRVRMGGDPGRIDYSNVTLKDMIRQAYQVKEYQISAPDWFNSTRFDVVAKVPAKTPKEQIPLMWQSLLADRFKLTLHREKKELPVYVLVVGRNGPKLKESEDSGDATRPTAGFGPGMPGGRGMMQIGRGRLSATKMSLASFADMLSRQMDRPVIDMTELKGLYDFTLEYTPDERQRMMPFMPGLPAGPVAEEHAPRANSSDSATAAGPTIFVAVQEQLGLKMEARKAPVEILVVDHAEKVPTEN